jgi:predicted glycosyltransferase
MAGIESLILQTLSIAAVPLSAAEVTKRLNTSGEAFTESHISNTLNKMTSVLKVGNKYKPKKNDTSQNALRIVREATEDH